jgi:aspartyl-tRNA(Asn)/glutamyl-tRNA(Gln) amidotransferase subunit A
VPADPDLHYLSIRQLGALYRQRVLSPVEATQAHLDRIDSTNGRLHAFVTVTGDRALAVARESERRFAEATPLGPLDGVPYAAKDVYDTKGTATTGQSAVFADRVPETDAAAVARLSGRGAVLLGKLTLAELGASTPTLSDTPPPARNPWDVRLAPGGSSSGPAVGVAAGLCVGALGTDAGGSIRDPAACCGVVGLKPTYGLVSRTGCIPLSWSLDHSGPLARSVEDCALLLEAIAGFDPADAASVDTAFASPTAALERASLADIRIGVPVQLIDSVRELDPEVEDAYHDALADLEAAGASIEEVLLPDIEHAPAVFATLVSVEALAFHQERAAAHPELYGRTFYKRLLAGSLIDAADYVHALRGRSLVAAGVERALATVDVLALPTRQQPAQPFGIETRTWAGPSLRHPFNLSRHPALSLPCGFTAEGLPIGLQLVGRLFQEPLLLAVAHVYEREHAWAARRPEDSWLAAPSPIGLPRADRA